MFGIVFELFVYKIYGNSDGAFLCGTEILNSKLNEMDFKDYFSSNIEQLHTIYNHNAKCHIRD